MRDRIVFQAHVPVNVALALAYDDGLQVEADSEIKSCTPWRTSA
jgi:hypothetical protein